MLFVSVWLPFPSFALSRVQMLVPHPSESHAKEETFVLRSLRSFMAYDLWIVAFCSLTGTDFCWQYEKIFIAHDSQNASGFNPLSLLILNFSFNEVVSCVTFTTC